MRCNTKQIAAIDSSTSYLLFFLLLSHLLSSMDASCLTPPTHPQRPSPRTAFDQASSDAVSKALKNVTLAANHTPSINLHNVRSAGTLRCMPSFRSCIRGMIPSPYVESRSTRCHVREFDQWSTLPKPALLACPPNLPVINEDMSTPTAPVLCKRLPFLTNPHLLLSLLTQSHERAVRCRFCVQPAAVISHSHTPCPDGSHGVADSPTPLLSQVHLLPNLATRAQQVRGLLHISSENSPLE
ncbi:hypothetical protein BJ875DRAFT_41817 [Amylocarpus encephaloides]|uniref:Uncharacterized protein n=1 Tax=Amylocarpus encephaloides TaxID=45428 RepID=A0A9P7YI11_9HELO|nr:hypothetical protein BJ875DRAFT_41817 [Amylocarpus encephaloides]